MASEVNIVISATDRASGVVRGISTMLGNIAKTAAGIAIASGVAFVALGKQALDATAEYERMSLTMESLVARELRAKDATLSMSDALALAGDESKRLLGWIQQVAIQSPFDMASVQVAYRQALTYGFASDQAQKLTQNMVDFAAANGLTAEAMQTVSYALGQINNNDKVLMLDLRQLMQVGVPVLDILKEMGMGFEDVSDGAVKSADFIAKFNEIMERDFGGAAARQTKSWTGLINTLGDIKKLALRELFADTFDALQPLVAEFAEWLQGDGLEVLRGWGEELGNITEKIINIGAAIADAGFGSIEMWEALGLSDFDWGDFSAKIANWAGDFWVNTTAALKRNAADVDWGAISDAILDGLNSIDWEVQGANFAEGARNLVSAISTAIGDAFREIKWGELFQSLGKAEVDFLTGMGLPSPEDVAATVTGIRNTLVTGLTNIKTVVQALFRALVEEGKKMGANLVGSIASGITGAMSAIIAAVRRIITTIQNMLSNANFSVPIGVSGSSGGSSGGMGGTSTLPKPKPRLKPTPQFAEGGIARGPESGYPAILHGTEAVLPLNKAGVFGGVTVNVNISSFMSLADQSEAEMKLVPIIERAIRSARGVV